MDMRRAMARHLFYLIQETPNLGKRLFDFLAVYQRITHLSLLQQEHHVHLGTVHNMWQIAYFR